MDIIESSKRLAAYTAVDNHIKPEHKVSEMFIGWVITLTVGPTGHWDRFWYVPRPCENVDAG